MNNAIYAVPKPANEPVNTYAPGTLARQNLKQELARQSGLQVDIPLIIGGKAVETNQTGVCVMPHDHQHQLARYCLAGEQEMKLAVKAAQDARVGWARMPFEHRAAVFLRAADLIAGPYRAMLNAATMLGQSKTAHQAEIDAACELIDFLRFNVYFASQIYQQQPASSDGIWNRMEYRPLDGFVVAVSPFNFTAIGGNLCTAPAIMGNTVIWKPAQTATLSNYLFMKILMEAGLPGGVINFLPSRGSDVSRYLLTDPGLGGFHFTGSTRVFKDVYRLVGDHIGCYTAYPRLVGETGGKDFIFAHASADLEALVTAMVLGAFEYQGQKCSAASRAYIPASIWPQVKDRLMAAVSTVKVGDVRDFTHFMGAVIDRAAYDSISGVIEEMRQTRGSEIICGGGYDDSRGYFIEPTVIVTRDPASRSMVEEIFGPVLTIYVYPDQQLAETLTLCDVTSPYALTGSIFAADRQAIVMMEQALSQAAGNFYINDKPTGAVVGQQPFGGGRASGTNDKAGSLLNLYRWINPRVIKENFRPPLTTSYPFMLEP